MNIGFFLKKFVTFFVEPLGLIATLLAIGLYLLHVKRVRFSKVFFSGGLFLFLFFSYPPFANFLVENLENQYPKFDYKQQVKYIHVLGNGHNTDPSQPLSSQISSAGTKRVLEGILIHKKMPDSKLIFTGYEGDTNTTNAVMNAKLVHALGVAYKDMIINGKPADTKEEALFTKTLVADKPFVLVTSATHMPRAMLLFRSLGMHPIAAPTNYYKSEFRGYLQAPKPLYFYISSVAVHEYIGILWVKIKSLGL
ncbi:YdcF family protein [Sulfurimonas sp. SWIR-19]|uniref:ElyC/SanA/YdcF family protein n=1 Tax=Sulfurimonas sp. SWIR-19 TaxID=2878390 RepID=UPI001CF312F2|nr:ElyC/SanA/YdcF family protein [Sulfurimonas sp. SWIR-19]UCN01394.1 YdcF family protein [Sulfurimonas sp. SWIR-19]